MIKPRAHPQHVKEPVGPLALGLALMAISVFVTLSLGLYRARFAEGDLTVHVLMAIAVNPAPYLFYGLAGFLLYHMRDARLLPEVFNLGAALLVGLWAGVYGRLFGEPALRVAHFDDCLADNLLIAGGTVVALIFLMLLLSRTSDFHGGGGAP